MSPARALSALAAAALVWRPAPAPAQGIEESLRRLGAENARLYAHPVVSGLGAALNSGFYHTAGVHLPLGFDFGIRAMGAFIPSSAETFVPVLPASIEFAGRTFAQPYAPAPGSALESPTAVGPGEGLLLVPHGEFRLALLEAGEDPGDYRFRLPEGFDFPAVPLALAQLAIGVPGGTEAVIRFLPSVEVHEDVGAVSLFGLGARHSLAQWLPGRPPVDLSIALGWQRFAAGEYLEAWARHVSLVASREVGLLTLYAGGALEDTDVEIAYTLEDSSGIPGLAEEDETIAFDDDADNAARFTVGATLGLLALRLNADYSFSRYDVLNVNLLVSYR